MKHLTGMIWAAVAVLGLYSPAFCDAGSPIGAFSSKGATVRSGGPSNKSSGSSFRSMPSSGGQSGNVFKSQPLKSGGLNTQVLKTPIVNRNQGGKLGTKVGPIVTLPGNTLPPVKTTPNIKPFPGPIVDTGFGKAPILSPFPGGVHPGLNPDNKRPSKPRILDPIPGGKPPIPDPGNGGGNGGGNNPPGGGNGGGNGNGGGHGHGHGHGHRHHWWRFPNYCLDWWCPPYSTQPYCGTVFLNGGWTYVTQPVAVEQISLVQVGEALPEIPSAATFKMQVAGLGPSQGMAAVEVNGVGMQAELLEWNGDSVVVRLPSAGLTQPLVSQLYILQSDGSMAKNLKFRMLPALQNAVAAN